MFTNLQKLRQLKFLILVFTIVTHSLQAQNEKSGFLKNFSFEGSADVYFRQNISGPNGKDAIAPNTSFANLNGFALGMANTVISFKSGKVGVVADLVFGPRGQEADFESSTTSNIINQLFVYWEINEQFKVTFGNFNTFLGYEYVSPLMNYNYSLSYTSSFQPFSHTGIKAEYKPNRDWLFLAGVFNENDFTEFNPTNNYTIGAQVGYKTVFLNFIYGTTLQIDITSGFDLTEHLFLGFNTGYYKDDDGSFYGISLYPQYNFNESFSAGLRAEYFKESDGGVGAIGRYDENGNASVYEITITGTYSIGNLMIKPEFRLDSTSEDTFLDRDLNPADSLTSFLVAAIYKF